MLNDDEGFVSLTRREDTAGRGESLCKPWGQALPFCSWTHSAIVYQAPGDTAVDKMKKKSCLMSGIWSNQDSQILSWSYKMIYLTLEKTW